MPTRIVKSATAGIVASIEVREGDSLAHEQTVLVLEIMKMEIPVESPCPGRLHALHVALGDSVEENQPLFTLHD